MSVHTALSHLKLAEEEFLINQPLDSEKKAQWMVWALATRIREAIEELEERSE